MAFDLNSVVPILMGISLAACAGLRAFMPLLAVGIAVRLGAWPVQDWFAWIATNEALITFGVATVLEVLGDKVPVLDHALDVFHTVARPVAGALVAMGAFYQVSPAYAAALGIMIGVPVAGGLHVAKMATRGASTVATAGFANPLISLMEDIAAVFGVILALIAPVVTTLLLLLLLAAILRWRKIRAAHLRKNTL